MKKKLSSLKKKIKNIIHYRKKKQFLLIRRPDKGIGLGSYILTNLGQIHYAVTNGMTPVIDMQNYENSYLEKDEVGKLNAWEFYFKQPAGLCINDIKLRNCKIVENAPVFMPCDSMDFLTNEKFVKYWQDFTKKYLILNDTTKLYIDELFKEISSNNSVRLLGVLCRGTDYVKTKPYGHSAQPEVDDVIAKAEEVMKEKCCDKIFLATEDISILSRFKAHFGEKVTYTEAMRYGDTLDKRLTEYSFNRQRDKYFKGREYLESLVILSKCQCLIGGRTNGTLCSLMMSNGFEYLYLWNIGRYGSDDKYLIRF